MISESFKNSQNIMNLFEEKNLVKICAPMVRYSKLQFRNLVCEYGCDLCYTPMILADSFCRSEKARNNEFTTNLNDGPLVVQFAANTVHDFVGASYMVAPYSNGVDLNCGCPQSWAKQIGVGCALLNQPELIADLVRQCRNRIAKPFTISVKVRILKDIKKTVEMCQILEKSGISYLSVHARTSSQHSGNIDTETLKLIVENVNCPVVGNGAIKNLQDCFDLQQVTKCKGVMVANGLLTNPTLFAGTYEVTPEKCVQKWLNICYNSILNDSSYRSISEHSNGSKCIPERPPNLTFQCFHHHLVFMLEKVLPRTKRKVFNNLQTFKDVMLFLKEHFEITPELYPTDTFEKYKILKLDYLERNEVYRNLKPHLVNNLMTDYNYENEDGKFFKSKLQNGDAVEEEYNLDHIFT